MTGQYLIILKNIISHYEYYVDHSSEALMMRIMFFYSLFQIIRVSYRIVVHNKKGRLFVNLIYVGIPQRSS